MKVFIALFYFVYASYARPRESSTLYCLHEEYDWKILGSIQHCKVINELNINSLSTATIGEVSAVNLLGELANVTGFTAVEKNIQYFPIGLNRAFINLKGIDIYNCGLKEVHRYELKTYPELVVLLLARNEIQVLEKGLFDFNPNLEAISFSYNKIWQISPNIFDNLEKLTLLELQRNECIDLATQDDYDDIMLVIYEAKCRCTDFEIETTTRRPNVTTSSTYDYRYLDDTTTTKHYTSTTTPSPIPSTTRTYDQIPSTTSTYDPIPFTTSTFVPITSTTTKRYQNIEDVTINIKSVVDAFNSATNALGTQLKLEIEASKVYVQEIFQKSSEHLIERQEEFETSILYKIKNEMNSQKELFGKMIKQFESKIDDKFEKLDLKMTKIMNLLRKQSDLN